MLLRPFSTLVSAEEEFDPGFSISISSVVSTPAVVLLSALLAISYFVFDQRAGPVGSASLEATLAET
jgi:hypothetical protein